MEILENQKFDEERALYGRQNLLVKNCAFDGPADGESAFKECKNIAVENCFFNLRYPFWHDTGLAISGSEMTPLCRAALWYSQNITIKDTKLHGIKALRECRDITLQNCDIISQEFGWSAENLTVSGSKAVSEYFLLRGKNLTFRDVEFEGKYSFQYVENAIFENCTLNTKDAFWHGKNITLRNCTVKGEYLAWYSENLTLENCTIIGTQPFCYCTGLKLVSCKMVDADLCFEKSQVEATLTAPIISIKNPRSGYIRVPEVGEIIMDDKDAKGEILVGSPV